MTASMSASSLTRTTSPTPPNRPAASCASRTVARRPHTSTDMPAPTSAGVLGITRTTLASAPRPRSRRASGDPGGDRDEQLAARHRGPHLGEHRVHHLRLHREDDHGALAHERAVVGRASDRESATHPPELARLAVARPDVARAIPPALDETFQQRPCHVAGADEAELSDVVADLLHVASLRGPKMAVPMRTNVAPSSIATSKSPLMPIESSGSSSASACRSRSARSARK